MKPILTCVCFLLLVCPGFAKDKQPNVVLFLVDDMGWMDSTPYGSLDPCVRDREEELAVRPDDLVLNGVWAFTHTGNPSGLDVSEVELISPNKEEK